jgi:hypothetical protein
MYGGLAPWFHLLTPPAEYDGEAAFALALLRDHVHGPLNTLLELGSGGGNLASHLKRDLTLTLTDVAPTCSSSAGRSTRRSSTSSIEPMPLRPNLASLKTWGFAFSQARYETS